MADRSSRCLTVSQRPSEVERVYSTGGDDHRTDTSECRDPVYARSLRCLYRAARIGLEGQAHGACLAEGEFARSPGGKQQQQTELRGSASEILRHRRCSAGRAADPRWWRPLTWCEDQVGGLRRTSSGSEVASCREGDWWRMCQAPAIGCLHSQDPGWAARPRSPGFGAQHVLRHPWILRPQTLGGHAPSRRARLARRRLAGADAGPDARGRPPTGRSPSRPRRAPSTGGTGTRSSVGVEDIATDIHCVTHWSKLDMAWRGVSLDRLFEDVETSSRLRHGRSLRRLHHQPAPGRSARRPGVDRHRGRG